MVLGLALLPALGNFGGGLLAEFFETNKRRLNRALHAAASIAIAIVSIELMPEALEKNLRLVACCGLLPDGGGVPPHQHA